MAVEAVSVAPVPLIEADLNAKLVAAEGRLALSDAEEYQVREATARAEAQQQRLDSLQAAVDARDAEVTDLRQQQMERK